MVEASSKPENENEKSSENSPALDDGREVRFIKDFHSSNFSDCPTLAPASSYVFMCRYSAVNIRKILLKFAILEKLRESLLSPILCHSLGKGYAIK